MSAGLELGAEPEWVEVEGSLFAHALLGDVGTRCGRAGMLCRVMSRPAPTTQPRCPRCAAAVELPP